MKQFTLRIYSCFFFSISFSVVGQCCKGKLYAELVALTTRTKPADLPVSAGPSEEVKIVPSVNFNNMIPK